jgi:GAF domain-containing protein
MVIPLLDGGTCFGVFDLDSPKPGRFREQDKQLVEEWIKLFLERNPGLGQKRPWDQ